MPTEFENPADPVMTPTDPTDAKAKPRTRKTYCRFCLSFCGLRIDCDSRGLPVRITGDSEHPVSKGYSCPKGRNLLDFYATHRLTQPVRFGTEPLSWEQALGNLGKTIRAVVAQHGPDAVALYTGTHATLDATGIWTALGFMYRLGSKSLYSVASVDAINKQVVVENMTAYTTLGLIPQVDFDGTDCLLLVGTNPIVSHGHLAGMPYPGKRLRDIQRRGGRVIVADPRQTRTAKRASLHIRPKPGTDYAWLGYVIRELLREASPSRVNRDYLQRHTIGLDRIKAATDRFDEATTTRLTGLASDQLHQIATAIGQARNFAAVTGTGVSFCDSGIVAEWWLWVLLALKGSLDRPGGVWFNPGYTGTTAVPSPAETTAWNARVPSRPDLPAKSGERPVAGLADEILAQNVRVLICLGGNPVRAFPNARKTMTALANLDALVVLETHDSDLVRLANFGLPVCGQLERVDSSIYAQNSAPVLSVLYTDRIVPPAEGVKPAWWVFSKLGEQLGLDVVNIGKPTDELDDRGVLSTIKGANHLFDGGQLLDQGYLVKPEKPIGWVLDHLLPDHKWRLASDTLIAELERIMAVQTPNDAPLLLVSMREDDHLNSLFMLESGEPALPQAFINPADAEHLQLQPGERIAVRTATGSSHAIVHVSEETRRHTVAISHGYRSAGNISNLTSENAGINPLSGMVAQSALEISIDKSPPK